MTPEQLMQLPQHEMRAILELQDLIEENPQYTPVFLALIKGFLRKSEGLEEPLSEVELNTLTQYLNNEGDLDYTLNFIVNQRG